MKLTLLTIKSSEPAWLKGLAGDYQKKITHHLPLTLKNLKAPRVSRKDHSYKKEQESELLLKALRPTDHVILLDERGKVQSSREWANSLLKLKDHHMVASCVFVVGGAYGVSEAIRERAQMCWSLSPLVLNHLLAEAVVLEQIYRTVSIWNNLPYHNE